MKASGTSQFSATDSMVGYLYQVRTALLWALRKLPMGANFLVSVETLDDVTFETLAGRPQELLQTKHHCARAANLTDGSPDLWKSLRIWAEGRSSGETMVGTILFLVTTSQAAQGSAAHCLRVDSRDVDSALTGLLSTSKNSSNKTNEAAYAAFGALSLDDQKALLNDIVVLDLAPTMDNLDSELQTQVFHAVERKHLESFLDRLEGWWIRRVLRQLGKEGDRILAEELEWKMADLREQFKQDALPIDHEILESPLDADTQASLSTQIFVRQLELTKAAKERIVSAIRDYYRAYEQRSRWVREELLGAGDLCRYEQRLVEEWELVFAAMKDKCGAPATEIAKERLAREVLEWGERSAPAILKIRPRVEEPSITRGSLHLLADRLTIGWHPDFRDRLAALLSPGATA